MIGSCNAQELFRTQCSGAIPASAQGTKFSTLDPLNVVTLQARVLFCNISQAPQPLLFVVKGEAN